MQKPNADLLNRFHAAIVFACLACAVSSRGDVVGYTTTTTTNDTVLTSVVVQRGQDIVAFDAAKLIPARVTHFKSIHTRNIIFSAGAHAPDGDARTGLLGDGKLTTGVINPGSQPQPLTRNPVLRGENATPGMAVVFEPPVATLYRCHADASDVRILSTNIEHDNTPWVLPDGRNEPFDNRAREAIGSSANRLLQLMAPTHYDVSLSDRERSLVRLWIDTSATYARQQR